jgi:hypothetical protein
VTEGQKHVVTLTPAAKDAQGVPMAAAFTYEFQPRQPVAFDVPWNFVNLALFIGVIVTAAAFVRTRRQRALAARVARRHP